MFNCSYVDVEIFSSLFFFIGYIYLGFYSYLTLSVHFSKLRAIRFFNKFNISTKVY